jgi:hypothetical protein
MQKISTMRTSGKNIFQGQLTIGVDLGDRSSAYCVLDEAGEIVLEHKLATAPGACTVSYVVPLKLGTVEQMDADSPLRPQLEPLTRSFALCLPVGVLPGAQRWSDVSHE